MRTTKPNQVKKKHITSKHQVEKDLGHRNGHVTTQIHFGRGFGHYGWKMAFVSYWAMNNIAMSGSNTMERTPLFHNFRKGGLDFGLAFNGGFTNHKISHTTKFRTKLHLFGFSLTCE